MKTSIVKVQLSLLLPAYLPWLHTWKYYFEKSRKVNAFENLYDKLTKEEKNEFNGLKTVVEMSLHSKEVLTDEELKENEALLMSCYYLHKLKKESNKKNSIKIEDINYLEELEKKGE